jgi:pimeloyl-ACP methyl ester carboxylesterase
MWRHQIPVLEKDWHLYAPDTRGFGGTDKPRERVTRDIQARDIIDLLDALEIERAHLVAHDWGGVIAAAVALKYPERVSRLALIDTLVSVWITWGIHGYWFKCEPEAEEFFEKHHRAFIRSTFGGEAHSYTGPPESPWAAVPGSEGSNALADFDPTKFWTAEDVAHYEEAFSDPGSWWHAIEYYRHALPFHTQHEDPSSHNGVRHEFLSNPKVAAMWRHPDLIFGHPDWADNFMVFAPEDWNRRFHNPVLYLFSPFLVPQAFVDGKLPPDDYIPNGNPYADSFAHHFTDLRTRGAQCGHFIPEEAPERTNQMLADFLSGNI